MTFPRLPFAKILLLETETRARVTCGSISKQVQPSQVRLYIYREGFCLATRMIGDADVERCVIVERAGSFVRSGRGKKKKKGKKKLPEHLSHPAIFHAVSFTPVSFRASPSIHERLRAHLSAQRCCVNADASPRSDCALDARTFKREILIESNKSRPALSLTLCRISTPAIRVSPFGTRRSVRFTNCSSRRVLELPVNSDSRLIESTAAFDRCPAGALPNVYEL
jgi:hypothetical protein